MDSDGWVTSPEVLELLLRGRAIKVGDLVRWEPNVGNHTYQNAGVKEVQIAESWFEDFYNYYREGCQGNRYPNGWRLVGWRRPK